MKRIHFILIFIILNLFAIAKQRKPRNNFNYNWNNINDTVIVNRNDSSSFMPLTVIGYYHNDTLVYIEKHYKISFFDKTVLLYLKTKNKWKNKIGNEVRIIDNLKNDTTIYDLFNKKRVDIIISYFFADDQTTILRFKKENFDRKVFIFEGILSDSGLQPSYCGGFAQGQIFLIKLAESDSDLGDSILISVNCPEFYGEGFFRKGQAYKFSAYSELNAEYIYARKDPKFDNFNIPTLFIDKIELIK